jgi:WD40 repeat protein
MSPDGSNQQRMTFSQNYDGDAVSWSPDSQWLIIPASRIGNYELYALKIDGSEFKTITRTEGDEYSGFLSPDGRYLLMNAYYGDYIGLVLRDLETQTDYQLTTNESRSSFATWLPDSEDTFDETWLLNSLSSDEDVCIYAEDETYGLTAENPMPIGNGSSFGGPFDGMDAYTFLRGAKGEAQEWARGHMFPSNANSDVMDTIFIHTEGGQEFELYVKIYDYSIPQIPAGMFCDLQLP